jgi:hypothetical protein
VLEEVKTRRASKKKKCEQRHNKKCNRGVVEELFHANNHSYFIKFPFSSVVEIYGNCCESLIRSERSVLRERRRARSSYHHITGVNKDSSRDITLLCFRLGSIEFHSLTHSPSSQQPTTQHPDLLALNESCRRRFNV